MENLTGSIWRKWDLHFHTPASFDYRAKGVSFQDLAKHINESDIEALAITDHWTLDGYFKLLPHIDKEKLILPGIELRIDKTAKQKGLDDSGVLQAIVIFPHGMSYEEIKKNFLHQIKLCEVAGESITREDLIALGKTRAAPNASDEDCYNIGCSQAYVDYKEVVQKAQAIGGLVCLTYDKYGGFENVDPVKDSIFKTNLVKDCDLIEVSKEEVQKSFYENPAIIKACGKKTPCFNGSDAHKLDEIGRGGIWIKSEKSFNGLKQIKYFPKERISFSKTKPTYSYPRIKSVLLEKHTENHALSSLKQKITFNDNLNAIIGHPSIGKSTFAETVAFLFDGHTTIELGEEKTKIQNMTSLNPGLTISAEVENGNVNSKISRSFDGEYGGNITKEEFPLTYLNQGYIDKTARDPYAVSQLIEEKMENPQLNLVRTEIKSLQSQLSDARDKYLRKFKLQEEYKLAEGALAKTRKFFDVSSSPAYIKLKTEMQTLDATEKKMAELQQRLTIAKNNMIAYEKILGDIPGEVSTITELYPSIKQTGLDSLPSGIVDKLEDLLKKLADSPEKKKVDEEKVNIATQMQTLLDSEGIQISEYLIKTNKEKQQTQETQLEKLKTQLTECDSFINKHKELVETLETTVSQWSSIDDTAIEEFNNGLESVNIQYVPADKFEWLVKVLTYETKQAWEEHTPASEKATQKFTRPSEDDIRKILQRIIDEKKIAPENLSKFLLDCIKKKEVPITSELECVRWLFGEKSIVIKEFLKTRLNEFAEEGAHQIYYMGKNISKEGMSFTERCGALLEILLQKGTEPVFLDQPEENLGSSYITKKLINKLLVKKFERQIIIVSHNPNTVVLADSDFVIAFDKEEADTSINLKSGAIESTGMKETICDIMEGGEEAFDLRAQRYKK